jgi:hypothetical protein
LILGQSDATEEDLREVLSSIHIDSTPYRGGLGIVVPNGALWRKTAASGVGAEGTPEFLVGTGLPTNSVYVEDLVFWLPLMTVGGWWLWHRLDWGYVVVVRCS